RRRARPAGHRRALGPALRRRCRRGESLARRGIGEGMTVGRAAELAEAPRRGRHRAGPRRPHLKATAGRLSWGLVDQAVSSLTNFAVGIYVARSLGVTAFGIFSVAWVTYGVVLNISRGLATDPLVVRFS